MPDCRNEIKMTQKLERSRVLFPTLTNDSVTTVGEEWVHQEACFEDETGSRILDVVLHLLVDHRHKEVPWDMDGSRDMDTPPNRHQDNLQLHTRTTSRNRWGLTHTVGLGRETRNKRSETTCFRE